MADSGKLNIDIPLRICSSENISDTEGNLSSSNETIDGNAADDDCPPCRSRLAPKEMRKTFASSAPGYCPSYGGSHLYEYIKKADCRRNSDKTMVIDVGIYIANPYGCSYSSPCPLYDESPEYVHAWIDWNCDKDFDDPGERVMDAALTGYTAMNYAGLMSTSRIITIPSYAKGSTWMRVTLGWGGDSIAPCEEYWRYGDVVDKPVNIVAEVPEIKEIYFSPNYLTTMGTIVFNADMKEVPEFEIYKVNWHVLNSKDNSEDFSGVGNPCSWDNVPPEAYGDKKVKCEVSYRNKVGGAEGSIEKTKDFKIFFNLGTANDPADDDPSNNDGPNWFEYWKKDKAVPNMDDFVYDGDMPHRGRYFEFFNFYRLSLGKSCIDGDEEVVLHTRFGEERFGGYGIKGIDSVSAMVAHELYHKWVHDQWKGCYAGSNPGSFCFKYDSDYGTCLFCNDFLPDEYEIYVSKTSTTRTDTYDLGKTIHEAYAKNGDHEYMARRAQNGVKGIASRDWAFPGKQNQDAPSPRSYSVSRPIKNACAFAASPQVQSSFTEKPIDANGNQLYDILRVTLNVSVNKSGVYKIVSRLNDTNGSRVTLENNQYLLSAGYNSVDVDFEGIQINRHGVDGPYNISSGLFNEWGDELSSVVFESSTAPYNYTSFEGQQARFSNAYDSSGDDGDGNGIYEGLNVDVGVAAIIPGNYSVQGYLYDTNKTPLAFAKTSKYLDAGNGTISLNFSGKDIALKKANCPYNLSYLSLYDEKGTLLHSASDDYTTDLYTYADFFSSPGKLSGRYSDRGADTNGDGYFECLELNVSAKIDLSGNYTLEGILYNDTGYEVADAHNSTYLGIGEHNVTLSFDSKKIYRSRINGSLNLTNLWLYDGNYTLIDKATESYTTQAHNYLNFTPLIRLTGNYSEHAIDNNSDGAFENLTIDAGVILANSGNCIASGRLVCEDGGEIAWTSSTAWLEGGKEQFAHLNFDGRQIYGHRYDGRYRLKDVYVYHTGDPECPDYAQDVYATAIYNHTEFNSSRISISGTKFNDLNRNGERDAGELGIPGWEIMFEQPPGTQILAEITSEDGSYAFDNLSSGICLIKEELRPGWLQSCPSNGSYLLLVGEKNISGCNFGNIYNTRPDKPSRPAGPASGYALVPINYSTSARDADGDLLNYTFDWGDNSTSEASLVNPDASIFLSHVWVAAGIYSIKVMATDIVGASSGWSDTASVKINANKFPGVPSVPTGPASGKEGSSYSYSTSSKDLDGDKIYYVFDWSDGKRSTVGPASSGASISSAHAWSAPGTYYVRAMATDSKGAPSIGWSMPKLVKIDPNNPPATPSVPAGPTSGRAGDSYSYATSSKDPDGDKVLYTFSWGDSLTSNTSLVASGTKSGLSHIWAGAGTYGIKARAIDSKGSSSGWSAPLNITVKPNNPPAVPSMPVGPASGRAGNSYSYSTSSKDPDGNKVLYTFYWGDGTTSNTSLLASGTKSGLSHKWADGGNYSMKARATDSKGAQSGLSAPINVTMKPNNPPGVPTAPAGSKAGSTGIPYSYSTSSKDPDGDKVLYTFSWGDNTTLDTKLAASGIKSSASHIWAAPGEYYVKARATDSKGASSGWSDMLTANITTRKPSTPASITGPSTGYAGASYSFSTSSKDPDKDKIRYTFDWSDGSSSEVGLLSSGAAAIASHSWDRAGTYTIKARATDANGAVSAWSALKSVKISAPRYKNSMSPAGGDAASDMTGINSSASNASDPSLLCSLGEELLDQGKYNDSLKSFEDVLRYDADLAPAWNGRGVALAIIGRLNESCESYGRALQIDPGYADAWYNRGLVLYDIGRYNESIECFDRAIALDPGDEGALYEMDRSLKALGNAA